MSVLSRGTDTMRLQLLFLLLLPVFLQCVYAVDVGATASTSATKQYDDSYEAADPTEPYQSSAETDGPQQGYSQDAALCPEAQPADDVKEVFAGSATFDWQTLAAQTTSKRTQRVRSGRPPKHGWPTHALAAGFNQGTWLPQDSAVGTAAVHDISSLMPSKLEETAGFYGTYDNKEHFPSYEALAVGPHPTDPDLVFMLHAVNAKAEMFLSEKDGRLIELDRPTTIDLGAIAATLNPSNREDFDVQAVTGFYDPKAKRYALVWSTISNNTDRTAPVFVAVSQSRSPLGDWVVWALDLRPQVAAGLSFCSDHSPNQYFFQQPQVSFSDTGIFIGGSNSCPGSDPANPMTMTALYVLAKECLYAAPHSIGPASIKAAVYLPSKSWYRSVTKEELGMVPDMFEPFNSIPAPARPHTIEDMKASPIFVMKVDHAHLSVATLTEERIDEHMTVDTAPQIMAVVVGKGDDFKINDGSSDGHSDGNAIMPQPDTGAVLQLGFIGMPRTYNGLVSWATVHEGQLYVATGEYWNYEDVSMPSIYWAVIKNTDDMCKLSRKEHGLVASSEALALAYPVIAPREDGCALLAFSFGGKEFYPGVATAVVGQGAQDNTIHIIKTGSGSITPFTASVSNAIPWGIGSAAQVWGGQLWFAVPVTAALPNDYGASAWYGSWVSWQQL